MRFRPLCLLRVVCFPCLLAFWAPLVWGADEGQASAEPEARALDVIRERLSRVGGDFEVMRIMPTPITGLYLVELKRQGFLYATADGQYLIEGDMYQVSDAGQVANLTDARRNVLRREMMATVSKDDTITFSPKGEVRAVVNVFTDVDCGFCRKLHLEMARLNELGIEIRYLAYPRTGIGTASYDKMVTAWCSSDPRDAITRLKRGEQLPAQTCENPVADEYELGRSVGVRGTPALVLESGEMLPGYVPADELAAYLGINDG